jgi:hypothetical protein
VLIHRSTVVLLTPQPLAMIPTEIYSGVHCLDDLAAMTLLYCITGGAGGAVSANKKAPSALTA